MAEKCCVVKVLNEDCNKKFDCRVAGRIKLEDSVNTNV